MSSTKIARVLGIETSCDETGIAVWDSARGLLAHKLYSQARTHQQYGGVVPELASRDHVRRLPQLTLDALEDADCSPSNLDAIAYTAGPGLIGALMSGASFACAMAYALNRPALAIHHMEAHLLAPLMDEPDFAPPFAALLVSGGHTLLMQVDQIGHYTCLGQSIDDAVGEAFDKTARILDLPYPGGPALAELAEHGDPERFHFPRPMLDREGCDMSFSGLKTHARRLAEAHPEDAQAAADIAAGFQEAVVDVLVAKAQRALEQSGLNHLVVAGGVGANRRLRARLAETLGKNGQQALWPPFEYCTDNGAMIAFAGSLRLQDSAACSDLEIRSRARWPLEELAPPSPLA